MLLVQTDLSKVRRVEESSLRCPDRLISKTAEKNSELTGILTSAPCCSNKALFINFPFSTCEDLHSSNKGVSPNDDCALICSRCVNINSSSVCGIVGYVIVACG